METTKTYTLKDGATFIEEDILQFEAGIPGFEHLKRFVLSAIPGQEPFRWLNSVDDKEIRFVVINPLEFNPDYNPNFQKGQASDLEIEKKEDMLLFVIITLQTDIQDSTANMAGPIVINVAKGKGKQVILDDPSFSVKEKFLNRGEG
jgi:flagellar assembly factor FliW